MRLFHNINIDFIGKRKYWFFVSIFFTLVGLIAPFIKGIDYGLDFIGGTEVVVSFDKPLDLGTLRNSSSKWGLGSFELKTFGTVANNIIMRTSVQEITPGQVDRMNQAIGKILKGKFADSVFKFSSKSANTITYTFSSVENASEASGKLTDAGFQAGVSTLEENNKDVIVRIGVNDIIKEGIRTSFPNDNFEIIKSDKVGPKIGSELRFNAFLAVIFSIIAMLIYIALRFKFVFGIGAVIALLHDVLIVFGFVVVFDKLIPGLNLEFNQQMIAAFLTMVGFSVNDTVVVFDRIRENLKIHKTMDLKELMNMSINKTLSRTVLTSTTVFLVVFVLLIFGGEVNQGFAFAFMIGVIVGTYSSIYVASAYVYEVVIRTKKKLTF